MSELIERLWADDKSSALTNEAARALEAKNKMISDLVVFAEGYASLTGSAVARSIARKAKEQE